jgi:hypothetical protein
MYGTLHRANRAAPSFGYSADTLIWRYVISTASVVEEREVDAAESIGHTRRA